MANWVTKAYWNGFMLWHARGQLRFPYRSLEDIIEVQNRRVRAIVAHAYDTVPYYREVIDQAGLRAKDFRGADDLARLPLLTGEQVADNPDRFLSRRYRNRSTFEIQSSGTAGHTKQIHYNPAALFILRAHRLRQRMVVKHFVGRMFGYRYLEAVLPDGTFRKIGKFHRSHSWTPRRFALQAARISPEDPLETNVAEINSFKPEVIFGYGSYIGTLYRQAWERKLAIFRPKLITYGSDRMADADRLLIEDQFGVPVLSTYGATESMHIGFQCERREGFHVSIDDVAVRVVDEQGRTLGPGGTGSSVISNLINRATVLLNYRLGDTVTLSTTPCPCGRTLPTLERIEGRADDFVILPDGRNLHSLVLTQRLQPLPGVAQIQLCQEELRRFTLSAVCTGSADWSQLRGQLEMKLRAVLGNDISLDLRRVDVIPPEAGGKVRAVISRYHP